MADQPAPGRFEWRDRIDYLVVEFPGGAPAASGFARLIELSNDEQILILDVEFLTKDANGDVAPRSALDLGVVDGVDLSIFKGALSYLLSDEDIQEFGQGMSAGSLAVIVVYQELAMKSAITAWQDEGAIVIDAGPADVEALTSAMNAGSTN